MTARPVATVDAQGRPLVPLLADKLTVGWPAAEGERGAPAIGYAPLAEVLTARRPTDAHFGGYSRPDRPVRLRDGAESRLPGGYPIVLLVLDVDGPRHHWRAANPGLLVPPEVDVAHTTWWAETRAQILRMREQHGIVAYQTGGGARVLGWIPPALAPTIKSAEDRARWARVYLLLAAHVSLNFGLVADAACNYPECLYRAPFVVRDGKPQEPEIVGDPAAVGEWNLTGIDATAAEQEARRLATIDATWRGRMNTYDRTRRGTSGAGAIVGTDAAAVTARWAKFSDEEKATRIQMYIADLATMPGSTSSSNGRTLVAARAGVLGFGIAPEIVIQLLQEHYVPRCEQQWTRAELAHKVSDGARSKMPLDYRRDLLLLAERTKATAATVASIAPARLRRLLRDLAARKTDVPIARLLDGKPLEAADAVKVGRVVGANLPGVPWETIAPLVRVEQAEFARVASAYQEAQRWRWARVGERIERDARARLARGR